MDEFDLSLAYIESKNNVLADAFLGLPIMDQSVAVGDDNINDKTKRTETKVNFLTIKVPRDNTLIDDEQFFNVEEKFVKDEQLHKNELYFNVKEDDEIVDLFLNLPPKLEMQNPFNMQHVANHQQQDAELLILHQTNPIQVPITHQWCGYLYNVDRSKSTNLMENIFTSYIGSKHDTLVSCHLGPCRHSEISQYY